MKKLFFIFALLALGAGMVFAQVELNLTAGNLNGASIGYQFDNYGSSLTPSVGGRILSTGFGIYAQCLYRLNSGLMSLDGFFEFGGLVRQDYSSRDLGTLGTYKSQETGFHIVLGAGLWLDRNSAVGLSGRLYPGWVLQKKQFQPMFAAALTFSLRG